MIRIGISPSRGIGPVRRPTLLAALAALAILAAARPAPAQDLDGRWLPWLGCWIPVAAPADAPLTCLVPEAGGVVVLDVTRGDVTRRGFWRGDGVERPVAASGCTGVEAVEFSADGRRAFVRSRRTCEGDVERAGRGLIAMVDDDQWIHARAMEIAGRTVAWVERYRPAPATRIEAAGLEDALAAVEDRALAVEAGRIAASAPIAVDALIEAHARTGPEAVRAWIAEQGEPLRLDADRLVRLADAGVPPEVIDVAIAVSYPERFAVAWEPQRESDDGRRGFARWSSYGLFDPFYFDPYRPYYYGFGSRYRFGYWSPFHGYYTPTVVVVTPVDGSGSGQGRVIKGRGYTRTTSGDGAARPAIGRPGAPSRATATGRTGASGTKSKGKAKPRGGG